MGGAFFMRGTELTELGYRNAGIGLAESDYRCEFRRSGILA